MAAGWTPVAMQRRVEGIAPPISGGGIEPVMATPPTIVVNGTSPPSRYSWVNTTVNEESPGRWTASFAPLAGAGLLTPGGPAVARVNSVGFAGTTSDSRQTAPNRIFLRTRMNEGYGNMAKAHGQYRVSITHTGTWLRLNTFSRAGKFRVRVDGELATLESNALGADLTNRSIDVTFATSATRLVEFEIYHGVFPFGIGCGPTDTVALPSAPSGKRLLVIGDSFADGAQAGSNGFRDMVHLAAAQLGVKDVVMDALGGTGYVHTNGAAATPAWGNFATRVGANIGSGKVQPDIVLVIGSVNDKPHTSSEIAANATSLFSTLNTSLPGVPVYCAVFGENYTNNANLTGRYAALAAAAGSAPNVAGFANYMSMLTGTGSVGNPKGDGTRDLWLCAYPDLTHPTGAGHAAYGAALADFLQGAV